MKNDGLAEANTQARELARLYARQASAGSIQELGGAEAAWVNSSFFFGNAFSLTRPVYDEEDLNERLRQATAYAASKPLPWAFFLTAEWLPELLRERTEEGLKAHGLAPMIKAVSMVTEELLPPRWPLPELEYVRIETVKQGLTAMEMNADAYGMDREPVRNFVAAGAGWRDPRTEYGFLAYRDGEAVSTATTILLDGRLYVAWVATPEAQRRKGYAEAVMRHSLQVASAESGLRRTVLHASPMGHPIYLGMGYRPTGHLLICLPAASHSH